MTLTLLSLFGLQRDLFPVFATKLLSVCVMIANRYHPFFHMAAFPSPLIGRRRFDGQADLIGDGRIEVDLNGICFQR